MTKAPKTVTLIWRNESYGSIGRCFAFRADVEPYPSDTAERNLARLYRRHGFKANETRAAWIAEHPADDAAVRLVEALKEAGYQVENEGAVPQSVEDMREDAAPRM